MTSKDSSIKVVSVELAWSRSGTAVIEASTCDRCKLDAPCLVCDTSDDEYGQLNLCLPCIQKGFATFTGSTKT